MCSIKKRNLFILIITLFPVLAYSYSLKTSDLELLEDGYKCVTLEEWIELVKILTFLDSSLTMFIPFTIILISNLSICFRLMKFLRNPFKRGYSVEYSNKTCETRISKYRPSDIKESVIDDPMQSRESLKRLSPNNQKSVLVFKFKSNLSLNNNNKVDNYGSTSREFSSRSTLSRYSARKGPASLLRRNDKIKRNKLYTKTTRMLILVSIAFLLLHSPIAMLKLYYYLKSATSSYTTEEASSSENYTSNNTNITSNSTLSYIFSTVETQMDSIEIGIREELLERITCYIYYFQFSINFFLYSLSGPKFRKVLFKFLNKIISVMGRKK
jgi:hypothetical protein